MKASDSMGLNCDPGPVSQSKDGPSVWSRALQHAISALLVMSCNPLASPQLLCTPLHPRHGTTQYLATQHEGAASPSSYEDGSGSEDLLGLVSQWAYPAVVPKQMMADADETVDGWQHEASSPLSIETRAEACGIIAQLARSEAARRWEFVRL